MIKSMTAFGRVERSVEGGSLTVEIRCLNRRYREISVRLPHLLASLEDRVKKAVSSTIQRGRADVSIKQRMVDNMGRSIDVNVPLAESYYAALSRLKDVLGLTEDIQLATLLDLEGIVSTSEPDVDLETSWKVLADCLSEALEQVDDMRVSEGAVLYEDMKKRLQTIEGNLMKIRDLAHIVVQEYQMRLNERISLLTEGNVELEPSRLAQEVAFLADKADVTEEIVRMESHLKQFRRMMESQEAIGRPLDFLLQEFNREINTVGSKSGAAEISHLVVEIKSELEKIREQVQNVE